MKVSSWAVILGLELVTVLLVISLFMQLDHQIAGLIAGFFFGLLGLLIGFQLLRTRTLKSFTFWWLFVYLFYSVIPMMLNRVRMWGVDFAEVRVWGMDGPEFHKVSERIYAILIVATVLDMLIAWFNGRRKLPSPK